jgi:tetratricopeptide (TPR) repeat protein
MIQLADDESKINRSDLALSQYQAAIGLAQRAGDLRLESLALARLGDLEEKTGDAKLAAQSYQQGLALDAKANDPRGEAVDWFNYGEFLKRHAQPDELVDACYIHAEELLRDDTGPEITTVQSARRDFEAKLEKTSRPTQRDVSKLLATASNLPTDSF